MDVAKELWNDKEFIKKRIDEQIGYVWDLHEKDDLDNSLRTERLDSAITVYWKFKNRFKELQNEDDSVG